MSRKRGRNKCVVCGKNPAEGWAWIGDDRYCHGDDDPEPTCYMRGQWAGVNDRGDTGWTTVFACVPCECGGMCDKCRQTEREAEPGKSPGVPADKGEQTTSGARISSGSRSVCLCDPDTDAVCDRNCA